MKEQKESVSVGERIAEKLKPYFTNNRTAAETIWIEATTTFDLAHLVNQELSQVAEENAGTDLWTVVQALAEIAWLVKDDRKKFLKEAQILVQSAIDAARGAEETEQKTLGSKTPPARERVNTETGLLPCPFCGDKHVTLSEYDTKNAWWTQCDNIYCGAEGPTAKTKTKAIELWNKRAPLTATNKEE